MSDQPPFVPPDAPPPAKPAGLASSSANPALPPPTGEARLGSAPPGSDPARRRGLRIALIVAGGLVAAGLLVGATVLTISVLDDLLGPGESPTATDDSGGGSDPEGDPEEPAPDGDEDGDGDPGAVGSGQTPLAVTPLDCDACFGARHVGDVIPADGLLEELGLSIPFGTWGDYPPYLAGAELDFQVAAWVRDGGSDDACFFTYPASPVGPSAAGVGSPDDTIEYLGSFTDTKSINSVAQSVRIFSSSAEASEYLTALDEAIPACDSYRLSSGWEPSVAPTPRFDLPDDVAAVGFVESMGPDALHVVNLQRGNLIVHVTLWTGRGGPTATDFRAYVEGLAAQIGEIEPQR